MHTASEYLDPVVRRASVVEDRTWRGGIEIVSHVNYDQLARVRVALGVMPDACGRTLTPESLALALRENAVPSGVAHTEDRVHQPLVLWTDIMAQICRVEPAEGEAPPRPVTPELHFGPVLLEDDREPLRRSA